LIASERVPARQAAVFPKHADVVSEFRSGRGRRRRPLPSKRRAPSHNPVSDDYLGPTPPVFPETGGSDAACCVSALAEERRPNDPVGKTPPFASFPPCIGPEPHLAQQSKVFPSTDGPMLPSGGPAELRTLASLCARVSAKQGAGSADLDGPATRVRAPAEQPRGLGDPRCTTLDEGVLERSPLGWPVRGACLHKRSIPGEPKSRRAPVDRQQRRRGQQTVQTCRPSHRDFKSDRLPEGPRNGLRHSAPTDVQPPGGGHVATRTPC
jgi:hypothetical protein